MAKPSPHAAGNYRRDSPDHFKTKSDYVALQQKRLSAPTVSAPTVQPRPAVDPTEAAKQRALEMRLERSGVLLAYEIVF
jgi:hypothetical protein